jgi:hypothetical protein
MILVFILEDVKDVRQSFVSILQVLKEKFFLVHVPIIEIIMGLVILISVLVKEYAAKQ